MSIQSLSTTAGLTGTTAKITAPPFMMGCWVRPATSNNILGILSSSGLEGWQFNCGVVPGAYGFAAITGGTGGTASAGTFATGWAFLLGRAYTSTQRWLDVLSPDGSVASGQDITSVVPSGPFNEYMLGSSASTTGGARLAEVFLCDSVPVIGVSTSALNRALLRQIAFGGPFSIPPIAKAVTEYYPLREWPPEISIVSRNSENYTPKGSPTWAYSGGGCTTQAPHPPLPGWRQGPPLSPDIAQSIPI